MTETYSTESESDPVSVPFIDLVAQYDSIRTEVSQAVNQVFESQAFVLGEEVAALETEIASFCDARHAIGCASGTDALILSLMGLGIGEGDEVITSPFTFFATASSIVRVGAKPVFVDIDPATYNLDCEQVEAAITDKTKAIMPVHIFGQTADMEPIWRLAVQKGLSVVEDACQAIGAEYRGRKAGVLGTVGCFSFFPTKNLGGAGDGGMITTDDNQLAERIRRLRVHGDAGGYKHLEVGMNSRLDALQAAVLRVKLRHLEDWTSARQQNARLYADLLRHYNLLDVLEAPVTMPDQKHVFNQFTVRVLGGQRAELIQTLRSRNVGCAVYYPIPLHLQQCFAYLGYKQGDLPESERASDEVMSLPIFSEVGADRQEVVVREIARAMNRLSPDHPMFNSDVRRAA